MIACQRALARFSYTRSRLVSLARFLFVGQSDVQGTRVTNVTETLLSNEPYCKVLPYYLYMKSSFAKTDNSI